MFVGVCCAHQMASMDRETWDSVIKTRLGSVRFERIAPGLLVFALRYEPIIICDHSLDTRFIPRWYCFVFTYRSISSFMLRRAVQSALRRPLSTMSASQTPMEDAIRTKVTSPNTSSVFDGQMAEG
jgi:hypothetical protein